MGSVMPALHKLVAAEFYDVAQVVQVGLIAGVEMSAIHDVWTHRAISYGIFGDHIRLLKLCVHRVLPPPEQHGLNLVR